MFQNRRKFRSFFALFGFILVMTGGVPHHHLKTRRNVVFIFCNMLYSSVFLGVHGGVFGSVFVFHILGIYKSELDFGRNI